ncbi:ankyrin repeat-containing domain protein [Aspergillus germanicus]
MSLLFLPNEIIFLISTNLDPKDIDSLVRSHPRFHCTLYDHLFSIYENLHGNDNSAALHAAASDGSVAVVERLLTLGVDVRWKSLYWSCTSPWQYAKPHRKVKDESRSTFQAHPISAAAANGHTRIVLKLLDHGADVNFKDIDGRRPLSLAARGGHMHTVRALVSRGPNLLLIDRDGRRAIANAASEGHHEIEDYLLSLLEAKRPRLTHTMKTEMHFVILCAAARGDEGRIKILLERGVEVDSQLPVCSHTPLCAAIGRGSAPLSTIKLLLENGANPSSSFSRRRGGHGPTNRGTQKPIAHAPLQLAIAHPTDSYAIIKMLIQHGMRLNIHYRILLGLLRPERFAESRLLCDAGMDIRGRPRLLACLYHRATAVYHPHRHQPLVDLLVEMGAEYYFEHIQRCNPLSIANVDKKANTAQQRSGQKVGLPYLPSTNLLNLLSYELVALCCAVAVSASLPPKEGEPRASTAHLAVANDYRAFTKDDTNAQARLVAHAVGVVAELGNEAACLLTDGSALQESGTSDQITLDAVLHWRVVSGCTSPYSCYHWSPEAGDTENGTVMPILSWQCTTSWTDEATPQPDIMRMGFQPYKGVGEVNYPHYMYLEAVLRKPKTHPVPGTYAATSIVFLHVVSVRYRSYQPKGKGDDGPCSPCSVCEQLLREIALDAGLQWAPASPPSTFAATEYFRDLARRVADMFEELPSAQ